MTNPKYSRWYYQQVAQILKAGKVEGADGVTHIQAHFERVFAADAPDTFDLDKFRQAATGD